MEHGCRGPSGRPRGLELEQHWRGGEEGWAWKGGDWVWTQRGGGGQKTRMPPHLRLVRSGGPRAGKARSRRWVEGEFGCELVRCAGHPGGNPCHGDAGKGGFGHGGRREAQGTKSMYLDDELLKQQI